MTISDLDVKEIFPGNDVTTDFTIPFDFENESEIKVYVRDESSSPATETLQSEGVNYTLTGGPPVTTVAFVSAPTSDQKVLIIRENPLTQATDYLETGEFEAETHEEAMDKLTRIAQELDERLDRALLLRKSQSLSGLELPDAEAQHLWMWNADADEIINVSPSDVATLGSEIILTADRLVRSDGDGLLESHDAITASRVLESDANGFPVASDITATELGYLDGVTENVQDQLNDLAGSGGGGISSIVLGSPAPIIVTDYGYEEYEFNNDDDAYVTVLIEVPTGYNAGDDLEIAFNYASEDTGPGDVRITCIVDLYRPGTSVRGTPEDTTSVSENVTMPGDATITSYTQTLSSSGSINATAMAAGDLITIEIYREGANVNDTSDGEFRIIKNTIRARTNA